MRFQPGPSAGIKFGNVSLTGASDAKYLSGWRICSVDCGSLAKAFDTMDQPPRLYTCAAHNEPSRYGNSNDSRSARGACLNCSAESSCELRMNARAIIGCFSRYCVIA